MIDRGTPLVAASAVLACAGAVYQVRSFHRLALNREPITVWILHRG